MGILEFILATLITLSTTFCVLAYLGGQNNRKDDDE